MVQPLHQCRQPAAHRVQQLEADAVVLVVDDDAEQVQRGL